MVNKTLKDLKLAMVIEAEFYSSAGEADRTTMSAFSAGRLNITDVAQPHTKEALENEVVMETANHFGATYHPTLESLFDSAPDGVIYCGPAYGDTQSIVSSEALTRGIPLFAEKPATSIHDALHIAHLSEHHQAPVYYASPRRNALTIRQGIQQLSSPLRHASFRLGLGPFPSPLLQTEAVSQVTDLLCFLGDGLPEEINVYRREYDENEVEIAGLCVFGKLLVNFIISTGMIYRVAYDAIELSAQHEYIVGNLTTWRHFRRLGQSSFYEVSPVNYERVGSVDDQPNAIAFAMRQWCDALTGNPLPNNGSTARNVIHGVVLQDAIARCMELGITHYRPEQDAEKIRAATDPAAVDLARRGNIREAIEQLNI